MLGIDSAIDVSECMALIQNVNKPCDSPVQETLQEHLQDLFTNGEDKGVIEASLDKISMQVLRDLICFFVWARKGRVEGVHPDFGRLSYLQNDSISSHYHLQNEERVEMILELTEKLN